MSFPPLGKELSSLEKQKCQQQCMDQPPSWLRKRCTLQQAREWVCSCHYAKKKVCGVGGGGVNVPLWECGKVCWGEEGACVHLCLCLCRHASPCLYVCIRTCVRVWGGTHMPQWVHVVGTWPCLSTFWTEGSASKLGWKMGILVSCIPQAIPCHQKFPQDSI